MQTEKPLVDIEFGLSQLGGNAELLNKMLGKFKDEFENTPEQVSKMIAAGDYEEPKIRVHTAKGITGNLGLSALFECCKLLDVQIKAQSVDPKMLEAFSNLMQATCKAIENTDYKAQTAPAPKHIDDALHQLRELLSRHEFIDDALLRDLVSSLSYSEQEQKKLIDLIEKLQYEQALSILNR